MIGMWTLIARSNMGPIWGRQGPGGPHVGTMIFGELFEEKTIVNVCTVWSNIILTGGI